MVAEIRVHDDDEVARRELQAVHVRGSQAQFAGAGLQFDVFGPDGRDQLFGDVLRAVGGAVVDDNYFPVQVAGFELLVVVLEEETCGMLDILFFECLLEEPHDDGKVAAFIVGGEDDGVLVADGHVGYFEGNEVGRELVLCFVNKSIQESVSELNPVSSGQAVGRGVWLVKAG